MCQAVCGEMEQFNVWLLEGLAYQLSQQFVTQCESCDHCMFRLISAWSHLGALLPSNTNENVRLNNWTILCELIICSYNQDIDRLEALVDQVEQQKCQMRVSDEVGVKALQFLHTKVSLLLSFVRYIFKYTQVLVIKRDQIFEQLFF